MKQLLFVRVVALLLTGLVVTSDTSATSVEDKAKRGSTPRAAQPMFWCYELGEGRVFGCVPGHRAHTFDHPVFRKLLLRGMIWAAGEE